jgi:alpha-glucosidase
LPLLVRAGSVVPMWPLMQHTGERPVDTLTLHLYPGTGESLLYEDDGHTTSFRHGHYRLTRFRMQTEWAPGTTHPLNIRVESTREGPYKPENGRTRIILHGLAAAPQEVLVDGQARTTTVAKPDTHPCPDYCATTCPSYVLELETFRTITVRTA